ncbi:MAG TPA: DUF3307 domain-containing protein [Candidatus Eisenbacteria bacterium]|jgi:hypothetical protein
MSSAPLLLKLVAAHLAGDYLLQPSWIAAEKERPSRLALHLAVHAGLLLLVGLTEPASARLWLALALVLAAHAAIDAWTTRRRPRDLEHLTLDQTLHLVSLIGAAAIARPDQMEELGMVTLGFLARPATWVAFAGGALAVPAGATVIGRWVRPFREALSDESRAQLAGLEFAGRWIGILERLVIFVAVLARVEALIGFVIAVKAALRLPEARERWSRELAEYYLVGSLASLSWALILGIIARAVLQRLS